VIELHFLRHADAGDPMAWTGDDADRPLSDKGRKQADRLGRFLAGLGFAPDAIITSPKVRAAQTAEIVAEHLGINATVDDRLAGALDLGTLDSLLDDAGDPARPVVVGHDPDFSDLVSELSGASSLLLRKGALARIDIDRPLKPGTGTLRWLVPPDLLKPAR
jgi:phosphohistidine phosphatase